MNEVNEVAAEQPELTKEQELAQINVFRDAIVKSAVDNNLSFNVVFNALSQVQSCFVFDFVLLTNGELTEANVSAAVERLTSQIENTAKVGLKAMQERTKENSQD